MHESQCRHLAVLSLRCCTVMGVDSTDDPAGALAALAVAGLGNEALPAVSLLSGPEGLLVPAACLLARAPAGPAPAGTAQAGNDEVPEVTVVAPESGRWATATLREHVDAAFLHRPLGSHAVVIIGAVDRAERGAQDHLLAVLEHPPEGFVVLLSAARPAALPAALRGRAVRHLAICAPDVAAARRALGRWNLDVNALPAALPLLVSVPGLLDAAARRPELVDDVAAIAGTGWDGTQPATSAVMLAEACSRVAGSDKALARTVAGAVIDRWRVELRDQLGACAHSGSVRASAATGLVALDHAGKLLERSGDLATAFAGALACAPPSRVTVVDGDAA
jgi:hypothetical protein